MHRYKDASFALTDVGNKREHLPVCPSTGMLNGLQCIHMTASLQLLKRLRRSIILTWRNAHDILLNEKAICQVMVSYDPVFIF